MGIHEEEPRLCPSRAAIGTAAALLELAAVSLPSTGWRCS
jgi:hypothetical protein